MAFFGINIAMGMMHLPQVSDYWSTNKILAHTMVSSDNGKGSLLQPA